MDYFNIDFCFDIIKNTIIDIFIFYIFFKIRNENKVSLKKIVFVGIGVILGTLIYVVLASRINQIYVSILNFILQCIICGCLVDKKQSIVSSLLVSSAIAHINYFIISFIETSIRFLLFPQLTNMVANLIIIMSLESLLNYSIFKIRKLNKGLQFLKEKINNEYLDIIMINISMEVIFIYSLFGTYYGDVTIHIAVTFFIVSIIMVIMTYKTMNLAYKHKQLAKNLAEDDEVIKRKDEEINKISKEKFEISKLNHEFEKRIKALELEAKSNMNMEISKENNILERIENLSAEYSNRLEEIKGEDELELTGIAELDTMFKYLQVESKKENIQFNLKLNCNMKNLTEKIIPINKLETLIGDIGTDAIIATKHSKHNYKSIVTIIDKKDEIYSISMADTGIEFEIDTLLKLGIEKATTHKDEGGNGFGFITVFEILKDTKASLIIEEKHEEIESDYTKNIIIRFDGKNEYKIVSYRADKIKEKSIDNRIKIENL